MALQSDCLKTRSFETVIHRKTKRIGKMRDREEGRRRYECLEADDRHDGVGYGLEGSWLGSHVHVVGVMGAWPTAALFFNSYKLAVGAASLEARRGLGVHR
jgi:hypothetical protein